jgi:UDP-N-acetylmuramate dehydrogenase
MIRQNVPLKDYSNYKIGGFAQYFLKISSKQDLIEGLRQWKEISLNLSEKQKRIFILGKGTNVLIDDAGFEGLVILNNILGLEKDGEEVTAGAGVLVSDFLDFCIDNNLSGFEWAGGLPGTIGGAVRGNAGAFGGETKDTVVGVESINFDTLGEITRTGRECNFGYRFSIFKSREAENEIIVSVNIKLNTREKSFIKQSIQEKIDYRIARHPLEYPNIGSIFKNISYDTLSPELKTEWREYLKTDPFPVIPVAKIIYLAGLKGKQVGDAQVSEKHTNFIINLGNATSKDVEELIKEIKNTVNEKYQIILEEEIMLLN